MQVNIKHLIDDAQCDQTMRELRWPEGVECPSWESKNVIKRGFDDTEPARHRYECHDGNTRVEAVTNTIFAGHHQPLQGWVWCLYVMAELLQSKLHNRLSRRNACSGISSNS